MRTDSVRMDTRQTQEDLRTPEATEHTETKTISADFRPDVRFYSAFISLSLVTLAAAFDATSIAVALPIITEELHGQALDAFWTGTSFLIVTAVLQPSWVSLSVVFGRRDALLASMVSFAIGAIVGATSYGFTQLLIGRVIQGVGGAGIWVMGEVVVTDLAPLRERPKWIQFITGAWVVGGVSGPFIGGGFAQNASWRWIFWINVPITVASFVLIAYFLRLKRPSGSLWSRLKSIDYVGFFLFSAGTTVFLIPLSWGGIGFAWSSWHTIIPLCLGVATIACFAIYSRIRSTETFIPYQIFLNRSVYLSYTGILFQGVILFGILYYLPLYYEGVKQYDPVITGVAMFPETFTVIPAAMVVGGISAKTGTYRWASWVGWLITTLGVGLLYLLDEHSSTAKWVCINIVASLGIGILYPGTVIAVMASAPQKHIAIAAGMSSFFRTVGQSIGVVIGGPIFQNRLKAILSTNSSQMSAFASQYARDATSVVQLIKSMPPGANREMLMRAYARALQPIWATLCGLAGISLILSLFLKAYSMDQPLLTDQEFTYNNGDAEHVSRSREKKPCAEA